MFLWRPHNLADTNPMKKRRHIIGALAVIALAAALMPAEPARGQTFVNSSFEAVQIGPPFFSDNLLNVPGWMHTGVSGDALLWAVGYSDVGGSITTAGEGNQFVTLGGGFTANDSSAWLQTVSGFTPSVPYLLSFDMASERSDISQSITVSFPSGSLTPQQTFMAGPSSANYWSTWEAQSMEFVPTASTVTFQFSAATQFDVGLDAIRLTAVPEPSSVTLIICSSAAAYLINRLRIRKRA